MVKRNYVKSQSRILNRNPKESKFADVERLLTFRAAMRDHVKANWHQYDYAKAKGYDPESYTDVIIGQIEHGSLRTYAITDPSIKGACKELFIPNTFKAIENFLNPSNIVKGK